MVSVKFYVLSQLPYGYGDLAPYMSMEQLRVHHVVHHQAYVDGANNLLKKLDSTRKENIDVDIKAILNKGALVEYRRTSITLAFLGGTSLHRVGVEASQVGSLQI